jgi:iron(III) transport system substrate-binding protein
MALLSGCVGSEPDVIVYAALDGEFSQPILEQFQRDTGLVVRAKFDTEATKTVGLANEILAMSHRPRCDVFWNNEILNTLRLESAGKLVAYVSPLAERYPAMYRSPEGYWHGFAARARILLVNTRRLEPHQRPRSILDLADARFRGQCGIAKPLFGTTATHAACLFAAWGPERAREYFLALRDNDVQILAGNKQVALSVAAGEIAFGLTDTDDAMAMIQQGEPVEIVYPDAQEGELGTLFIPNTLCILRDAPHPDAARRLVDYLLRPEVEAALARGPSAQIPLGRDVPAEPPVATPRTVPAMRVDFREAARYWDTAAQFLRQTFAAD